MKRKLFFCAFFLVSCAGAQITSWPPGGVSAPVSYANGGTNATTNWTQGGVFFGGPSAFGQDASNFFWDATNRRLGIGTNTPSAALDLGSGSATGTGSATFAALLQSGGTSRLDNRGVAISSSFVYGLSSTTNSSGTFDTALSRCGAGVACFGTGANGNSAAQLKAAGFISGGTTFAISGCSATTPTGGATSGSFVAGATTCTVTLTMGNALAAPTGWVCLANDITTPANSIKQSASTTTTATLTGTVAASDVVNFTCHGY